MIIGGKSPKETARVAQIVLDCTAPVIVPQKPNDEPRGSYKAIGDEQTFKRAEVEHHKAHDVGDQFPIFGHETFHSGLSFKAKQFSSFRVSIQ